MTFILEVEQNYSQDPVPTGTYTARIVHVAMLGKHLDTYEGKTNINKKIGITYEIVDETRQAINKPSMLIEIYNISTHRNSRLLPVIKACIEKLYGKPKLDLTELLDKPVAITVIHNSLGDSVFSKITEVSAVPGDIDIPKALSEVLVFNPEIFDDEVFLKLPRRFRKMISERIIAPDTGESP